MRKSEKCPFVLILPDIYLGKALGGIEIARESNIERLEQRYYHCQF